MKKHEHRYFLKEIFDKVIAFIALIILLPLFLIVAVLIKIDSKGPVFFMQERDLANLAVDNYLGLLI